MRYIRNVLCINGAGNNPVHEESAVAAGATRDTRSGVRKMSGVRASTALLVGGALCALLLLLGGCSDSNDTCDTGVAGGDCDGDGVTNGADAFPSNACASMDRDGDGHPDTLAAEDATVGTTTCTAAKRMELTDMTISGNQKLQTDNCPDDHNPNQADVSTFLPSDGLGDACDTDVDDDDDGLIEINSLEDLDAIRNDLDGDGAAGAGCYHRTYRSHRRADSRPARLRVGARSGFRGRRQLQWS